MLVEVSVLEQLLLQQEERGVGLMLMELLQITIKQIILLLHTKDRLFKPIVVKVLPTMDYC
jgi:hypothetical protein